ncbi:MAG TPA: AAA family ATPase [Candidatus Solibacter sp.]|jgi:DNA repair exonuclease SbcCD ATPase subunit|nr:AAA family ATPase [Candidatus Solibacter sp.]
MRLLKLRVRGFKGLRNVQFDLDHDRVLVVGPNEAGKSTFMDALVTGLYGLAPSKRGAGHSTALKQVLPWTGEPAGLSLTLALDEGTELEVDWDLSGERTRVFNHSLGQDISASFATGTHGWLDVGDSLLHLPGSVFGQVACVGEGELALINDDAEVRRSLLRVTDAGVDVLVEQAIQRLHEAARHGTVPKVNAATRRNQLGRGLAAVEAELAAAREAREALAIEVGSIERTEVALGLAQARADEAGREIAHRESSSERVRVDLERTRGRLSEAEIRAAAVGVDPDDGDADLEPPEWTDEEMKLALQALVAEPSVEGHGGVGALALVTLAIGVLALVMGMVLRLVVADGAGAAIIAVGVYLATRGTMPASSSIRVGDRRFRSRQDLMAAIDQERARRDLAQQRAAVEALERRLSEMRDQPRASAGGGAGPLSNLSGRELARLATESSAEVQRLASDLVGQRSSLERGARQIMEVAPLEERAVELRQRIAHLEAFGDACVLAAQTLASASEEIRRAYAPKLQAHLSRDLEQVTDGRYREALVSDRFEVLLRTPDTGSMVDLKHLSRGTQQQIYLLLRLGLLEVMSGGTESLPMLLDDALALADDARRTELLSILEAQPRQVIYFTAGETEAAATFGADWHRVEMPRPATGSDSGALLDVAQEPGA